VCHIKSTCYIILIIIIIASTGIYNMGSKVIYYSKSISQQQKINLGIEAGKEEMLVDDVQNKL